MNPDINKLNTESQSFLLSSNAKMVQSSKSFIQKLKRPFSQNSTSMVKSKLQGFSRHQNYYQKHCIKEENIRLVTKLAQIKGKRPNKYLKTNASNRSLTKHENPEKKRLILLENQRLARNILKIKLGPKKLAKLKRDGSLEALAGRRKDPSKVKKYKIWEEDYNLYHLEGNEEHYQGLYKRKAQFSVNLPSKRVQTLQI